MNYEGILLFPRQARHCENWLETTCEGSKWKWSYAFRALHEHADSERRCTSDLKHVLLIIDDANDAEEADAADFAVPAATCRRCPRGGIEPRRKLLVNQPVREGGAVWGSYITMKFHAIGDSSPPNTLLKQEGLQLVEASFRDLELEVDHVSGKNMQISHH